MTLLSKLLSPARDLPEKTPRPTRPGSRSAAGPRKGLFSNPVGILLGVVEGAADSMQKYQDIPLRFHRQWLTTFLACLLLVGVISGIYLNVTSRAAITGREIQTLEIEIVTNQQKNADLQTNISGTLSSINLEARAAAAGFVPLSRDEIKYLVVPGYAPEQKTGLLPINSGPALSQEFPAEYSETLITWLTRQLESASTPLARTH
jgi:cell division protein FtsL